MKNNRNSDILSCINGKNIFLTGATGFVGKLLVEQLLRKCDPNKLFLLIRPKNDVKPAERIKELFEHVIFEKLKKEKPNCFDKVELISGDMSAENLGLSEESKLKLTENVNLVIHGAATVKFDEPLRIATNINVKGTASICKLCHQMEYLEAFVHVSTAYCNCPFKDINEAFYESPIDCDKLINITERFDDEHLARDTDRIRGNWPNTYAFTKAVAEDVIRKYGQGLPVAIFRPAMVVSTDREPIPGWIDNMYGPVGFSVAVAYGVLKVLPTNSNNTAELVPGDKVASGIIASLYATSKPKLSNEIKIYNFVTDKENQLTWSDYARTGINALKEMPFENALLPPSVIYVENPILINILVFLLHFLPAVLLDSVHIIIKKKPRALKLYGKTRGYFKTFSYFSLNRWNFSNDNVQELWNSLSETDKQMFHFNMKSIKWQCFIYEMAKGVRLYLAKEMPDSIPRALKKYKRQILIKNVVLYTFYIVFAAFISKILLVF